jgi:hypothetical protein
VAVLNMILNKFHSSSIFTVHLLKIHPNVISYLVIGLAVQKVSLLLIFLLIPCLSYMASPFLSHTFQYPNSSRRRWLSSWMLQHVVWE